MVGNTAYQIAYGRVGLREFHEIRAVGTQPDKHHDGYLLHVMPALNIEAAQEDERRFDCHWEEAVGATGPRG
jgi:hypothetical protein